MQRDSGFTLVEILIVTIIIGVLIAILLPVLGSARRHVQDASCQSNLMFIGQALAAYRQDNGVYPNIAPTDNPIGALALAYPKLLHSVPTCPKDPTEKNDSYGPNYNYWGYKPGSDPQPITDGTTASSTYSTLQSPNTTAAAWANGTVYATQNLVTHTDATGSPASFICIQNHLADATNEPIHGSFGALYWAAYPPNWWRVKATPPGNPDTNFPGLANAAAPNNTIVTICPYHTDESAHYAILRKNGDVSFITPPTDDPLFWTLSHLPQ